METWNLDRCRYFAVNHSRHISPIYAHYPEKFTQHIYAPDILAPNAIIITFYPQLLESFMEFEQIIKKLEWLDEEHRKDKAIIKGLEERILTFEGDLDRLSEQNKDLGQQINEVTPLPPRVAQFEEIITKLRSESSKSLEELEKNFLAREGSAKAVTGCRKGDQFVATKAQPKRRNSRIEETYQGTQG